MLSQTALEREALRGQLEVTSSKLADALRRLEEERAQRQRGEDKAEAEAAAMHAECGAVKATAQEASLKWDYAVREVGAARAELLAVRAELSDCKQRFEQRFEAAETTKAAAQAAVYVSALCLCVCVYVSRGCVPRGKRSRKVS